MAKSGGSRGRAGRPGRPMRTRRDAAPGRSAKPTRAKTGAEKTTTPAEVDPMPAAFVLGAIAGATVGGWVDAWRERMPSTQLQLRLIASSAQRTELLTGALDAALVRLPIDATGLHVIPLYDEIAVVVCSTESHLMAAEELDLNDLAGEIVIVPQDDVLGLRVPGSVAASSAPPESTEQAIATVAAGVGIVIVPMSLARQYRRKDAASRPLRDVGRSTVALAWAADRTTPAVDAFIGIVRGRTPNSSRD